MPMALTETLPQPHDRSDRSGRRRPFSTWVKKLANFKNGSSGEGGRHGASKRHAKSPKDRPSKNNNPYPQSGRLGTGQTAPTSQSFSTARSALSGSATSLADSVRSSSEGQAPPTAGARSMAPTVSTDHEGANSIAAPSHIASSLAGTSRTANGGLESRRGGDSTFSSPAPSVRSLTTTLTTIQSMGPNSVMNGGNLHSQQHANHAGNSQTIQFNQPFPSVSPASAIPSHLAPTGHPTTYTTATANNLLTDNASILTLASSSKRRRRRSLDTDASVRALAPSSLWGGSRESLPLSVLSANVDGTAMPPTPGLHQTTSRLQSGERNSLYSATGITPSVLASERNSYYAKERADATSVRSGMPGHGRADSINGSIAGGLASPLASPREAEEKNGGLAEKVEGEEGRKPE